MRVSRQELGRDAIDALATALTDAGLRVHPEFPSGDGVVDLVLDGPSGPISLEVKATSVADPGRIATLIGSANGTSLGSRADATILVADELSEASRKLLREHGWGYFDRRGRLWLRINGVTINDTELQPQPRHRSDAPGANPLTGRVALGMALWMLMHPDEIAGVRALSRELECSPSTAHDAMKRLKGAALVRPDNAPLLPELFWAVADVWRPERHYVVRAPAPDDAATTFGLGEDGPALVISSDVAAAAWGAPVVVQSGARADFYVAPAVLQRAVRRLGPASETEAGASLAAAPIRAVWKEAFDHPSRATPWLHWPLAHPVVVALDLAQDRSRGREIIADWDPPDEMRRVW
jgi:hypothetical protein